MADINVTPLVDVMLVLLIVFMIAAPMLTVAVPVDLPKAQGKAMSNPDNKPPLILSIDQKGVIYIQETPTELESLVSKLKAITGANPDARIFVRGDRGVAYGRIMEVMGTVTAAGYNKVSLVAEPPKADLAKQVR
jgi:biopolymer transport protein TolR